MQIIKLAGKRLKESKFLGQVIQMTPVYLRLFFGTVILKSFLNIAHRVIGWGPIVVLIFMPVPVSQMTLSGVHMGTLNVLAS